MKFFEPDLIRMGLIAVSNFVRFLGKRKWKRFDERVMRHLNTTRPVYGRPAESRLIRSLDELTFSM